MRRLVAAGGLAIAACTFWLLFSGAASARQASDGVTVTAVETSTGPSGTNYQLTGDTTGSGVTQVWVDGTPSSVVTAISGSNATCNETPSNNGGSCSYATSTTHFVINITESGPPVTLINGQVSFADATTATFQALVTVGGTPECDWVVKFNAPPNPAVEEPISYTVDVTNEGQAACPAADLDTSAAFPGKGDGTASAAPVHVPALAPGGAIAVHPTVRLDFTFSGWAHVAYQTVPVDLKVIAAMPQDADNGVDESATAVTALAAQTAKFGVGGPDATTATCPGNDAGSCKFSLHIFVTPQVLRGATPAGAAQPVEIGSAQGTIKRGKKGTLSYKLNKTGRTLEKKKHKLAVTLIGTRKQGSVSTFIKGHVTLH